MSVAALDHVACLNRIIGDLRRTAAEVREEVVADFLRMKVEDPAAAFHRDYGFHDLVDESKPLGKVQGSAKYVIRVEREFKRQMQIYPYFEGVNSVFDVGAGPGYLIAILSRMGKHVTGIDLPMTEQNFYRRLRRALGVDHLVTGHEVIAYESIPIPPGTECLTAFGTVFNAYWSLKEHLWFLQECREKLSGPKRILWRFNNMGFKDPPEIEAYYRSVGQFPLPASPEFCVMELA